ncbi:MAG TPA: single-stranded DNA-binding protein [Leptospiraceae bacterium]|nr:single-stranded DNA-binding protein [Leptospiraceae bacterium]HMW08485.1 single-stranded DNA-binding protein [Leptospiraceae bacterium]HMX33325.1 single-stranded DNA-binding protein [Leptospiraceae bacterium]HMY34070.1 single-stranded DNA-binding protein [Leptospiraceae bacterium]HMZ64587.1 single-stranded DNA-binding protein [Leptospiraceae bacterium]
MRNLAFAILDGNLTADPELKTIGNGKKVSTFSLAVNHDHKEEDGAANNEVSYIDIEAWDKVAENCSEFLKKGRKVTILGYIKQDRWKSADGANRQRWKVIASTVRFDGFAEKANKEYRERERKAA